MLFDLKSTYIHFNVPPETVDPLQHWRFAHPAAARSESDVSEDYIYQCQFVSCRMFSFPNSSSWGRHVSILHLQLLSH